MRRRCLYNKQYGFFPFCAPAGFRHENQPVDIVDIYHKYNNADKKYIFTLRDNVEKFALTQGDSVRYGYELNGVKYEEDHNVVTTTVTNTIPAGMVSEIMVNSTVGFPESGSVRFFTSLSFYEGYLDFNYTSKTQTKLIGISQSFPYGLIAGVGVYKNLILLGINRWVLINGNENLKRVLLFDIYAVQGNTYEWLYCGRNINIISCSNSGLGYGSAKYVHLENKMQLTALQYCDFYGVPLTGILTIPESITSIDEQFFGNSMFSVVNISKSVISLRSNQFNYKSTIQVFISYPLIAPIHTGLLARNPIPELHISRFATGYDVYPWNDKTQFTQIIRDL